MGLKFHQDALAGIPRQDASRLKNKIDWLWHNRSIVKHTPLKEELSGFFKKRLGKYRIIYTYDPDPDDMVIRKVGRREEIYRTPL